MYTRKAQQCLCCRVSVYVCVYSVVGFVLCTTTIHITTTVCVIGCACVCRIRKNWLPLCRVVRIPVWHNNLCVCVSSICHRRLQLATNNNSQLIYLNLLVLFALSIVLHLVHTLTHSSLSSILRCTHTYQCFFMHSAHASTHTHSQRTEAKYFANYVCESKSFCVALVALTDCAAPRAAVAMMPGNTPQPPIGPQDYWTRNCTGDIGGGLLFGASQTARSTKLKTADTHGLRTSRDRERMAGMNRIALKFDSRTAFSLFHAYVCALFVPRRIGSRNAVAAMLPTQFMTNN